MFMLTFDSSILSKLYFEKRLMNCSVASFLIDSKSRIRVLTFLNELMQCLFIASIVAV